MTNPGVLARDAHVGPALAITTLGVLVLQLSLTRLFSVVLFYHYAFLVISIALLGLAVGGILARLRSVAAREGAYERSVAKACIAAALTLIPVLSLILGTNVWFVTAWASLLRLILLFLTCAIPFTLVGFIVSTAIARAGDRLPKVYFFDLLGASAGCLVFVPLMGWLGGPATVLAVGFIWCLAALVWTWGVGATRLRIIAGLAAVVLGVLAASAATGNLFRVQYLRGVPVKQELFTRWNSFSRVSVYSPDSGKSFWIEMDGGAGSWISTIDPDGPTGVVAAENLGRTGPEVAYWLNPRPKSLVIGPGGGVDVVRGVVAGSPSVTTVEINPLIARDVMLGSFRRHSHGLYARPDVKLVVEDGRTFIERTSENFDVILLSQVDTWASSAAGSYALTENYLYTVDALEKYFTHLTERGILSVGRWEFPQPRETLRLSAIALEALTRRGVAEPRNHIIVITEQTAPDSPQRMGTVLVSRTPWDSVRLAALDTRVAETPMDYSWAPHTDVGEKPFRELMLADDRGEFMDSYPFDISPVTDDRPFFFFTGRWSAAFEQMLSPDLTGDTLNTNAQFLLVGLLVTAILAVIGFLVLPMIAFGGKFPSSSSLRPFLLYGVALGLGFIIIEVALIQRLVVLLGQPVYSLTVVVFMLLFSSALGSRFSSGFPRESLARRIRIAAAGIVAFVAMWIWVLPRATDAALGLSPLWKLVAVGAAIFPMGFLMGIPFPSGLRLAAGPAKVVEWTWAMNAAGSVLGTVLAIFLALTLGISAAFGFAAVAYAFAAVMAGFMQGDGAEGPPPP